MDVVILVLYLTYISLSDVKTTISSRPYTSTEARKPSEAAMRIAAARAAANKNSLPRKPKTGTNKVKI